jgi:hypothetical protein
VQGFEPRRHHGHDFAELGAAAEAGEDGVEFGLGLVQ